MKPGFLKKIPRISGINIWGVIHDWEAKLLAQLEKSRTMQEIVEACIVYRRALQPAEIYEFTERAIMKKHLEILVSNSIVAVKDGKYSRIG